MRKLWDGFARNNPGRYGQLVRGTQVLLVATLVAMGMLRMSFVPTQAAAAPNTTYTNGPAPDDAYSAAVVQGVANCMQPPADLDLTTVTDPLVLASYGVPRQPTAMDAASQARYADLLHSMKQRVCPSTTISPYSAWNPSSYDWAGYVGVSMNTGHDYWWVASDFIVPALACSPGPNASVAYWVGLGGATSLGGPLVQNGVVAHNDSNCVTSVDAFYEDYPADSATIDLQGFHIYAGQHIYVSSDSDYTVHNSEYYVWSNRTTGQYAVEVESQPLSNHSTAEWIAERPSCFSPDNCPFTLGNFGGVGFMGNEALYDTSVLGLNQLTLDSSYIVDACNNCIPQTLAQPGGIVNVNQFPVLYTGP